MEILEILNKMEEFIEDSTKVPLVGKTMIDDEILLEFIDRIRSSLPEEIRQARKVVAEGEKIISEARLQAQQIVDDAKKQIERMAGESEVSKKAQQHAEEIIKNAKNTAREIHIGAKNYADGIMAKLQSNLEQTLTIVKKGREELKGKTAPNELPAAREAAATKEK